MKSKPVWPSSNWSSIMVWRSWIETLRARSMVFGAALAACRKTFEGRNRAKIWQHCKGQEHRAKLAQQNATVQYEAPPKPKAADTPGKCGGLVLSGPFAAQTRIGGDLRPVWDEYVKYANLDATETPKGEKCASYTRLPQGDWCLRSGGCKIEGEMLKSPTDDALICRSCLDFGSNKKLVGKVCLFVADLDLARLLHARMYKEETVDQVIQQIRDSVCYKRRCKLHYEKSLDKCLDKLHSDVASIWRGRLAHTMTVALESFFLHTVKPAIDVEPWQGIKERQLQSLLDYMSNDPNTPTCDMQIVRGIVTGSVARHPAVHGMLAAIACKVDMLERGLTTMRNNSSDLVQTTWRTCCGLKVWFHLSNHCPTVYPLYGSGPMTLDLLPRFVSMFCLVWMKFCLDSLWWFCLLYRLWTHFGGFAYCTASALTLVVLLIVPPLDSLWWFCLLYRLWTHFGGFAYCTASGLTLVVLLIVPPLDSLWWFCLLYRLWTHFGGFAYCTASGLTLVVLLIVPLLDSLWWFCLWYRMVEALGVVWILFQLGCVSASGLTLVVLLIVPPLDSLWWFCLLYRLWTHFGGFAYCTASGLTLVVLLIVPPLEFQWDMGINISRVLSSS